MDPNQQWQWDQQSQAGYLPPIPAAMSPFGMQYGMPYGMPIDFNSNWSQQSLQMPFFGANQPPQHNAGRVQDNGPRGLPPRSGPPPPPSYAEDWSQRTFGSPASWNRSQSNQPYQQGGGGYRSSLYSQPASTNQNGFHSTRSQDNRWPQGARDSYRPAPSQQNRWSHTDSRVDQYSQSQQPSQQQRRRGNAGWTEGRDSYQTSYQGNDQGNERRRRRATPPRWEFRDERPPYSPRNDSAASSNGRNNQYSRAPGPYNNNTTSRGNKKKQRRLSNNPNGGGSLPPATPGLANQTTPRSFDPAQPDNTTTTKPAAERDAIQPPSAASGGIPTPTQSYLHRASLPPHRLSQPKPHLGVIDLNGTLLYRPNKRNPSHFVERPHARTFLQQCLAQHSVVIWSSARPENVQRMCAQLFTPQDLSSSSGGVVAVWGRDRFGLTSDDYNRRTQCYKRLTRLWEDPFVAASHPLAAHGATWNQGNTVLIDDSAEKARSEPYNAVTLPEFAGDLAEEPQVLPLVEEYLEELSWQMDVSSYMRVTPFSMGGTVE